MGLFSKESIEVVDETIPKTTGKVPLVPFKILEAGIPFYQDEACTQPIAGANLVRMQTLDPEDAIQEVLLVPTRKNYSVGQYVTLSLNNRRLWEDVWYKDPGTGTVQKAFNIHVEFEGEVLEPSAVEADRERIEALEKGVAEKLRQAGKIDPDAVN